MSYRVPTNPKIYHILHIDKIHSVVADNYLWSDSRMAIHSNAGTAIGIERIKQRRLNELKLACHPELYVGQCVPFYFCPRSIMLYMIYKANDDDLIYRGGQEFIVHLEADLYEVVQWANTHNKRWAFTLSNAGAYYFEDRNNLEQLSEINWPAVMARDWQKDQEGKKAEFLIEENFPWELIRLIGVYSSAVQQQIEQILITQINKPTIEIRRDWYS